jgi:RNA polymerase sigma-70 factor (ECF subfamily)
MTQFQKGNLSAFEELIRKYETSVINTIYRYTNDRAEAEDLSQEVFIRVFKSKETYRPTCPFRYWLFTILTNLCLNKIRDTKRHHTFSIFNKDENRELNIEDTRNKSVSDNFKQTELQIAVRQALDSLPTNQKMVVILNKYEELSYEEIGQSMKLSVSAVKSLLFRARENLKDKLKGEIIL